MINPSGYALRFIIYHIKHERVYVSYRGSLYLPEEMVLSWSLSEGWWDLGLPVPQSLGQAGKAGVQRPLSSRDLLVLSLPEVWGSMIRGTLLISALDRKLTIRNTAWHLLTKTFYLKWEFWISGQKLLYQVLGLHRWLSETILITNC